MIPRVSGTPVLGNLGELRRDWLGLLTRVAAECGDVGSFRVGPRVGVVINHPALAGELLVRHAEHLEKGPLLTRLARLYMGDGLITCPQAGHAEARAHLAPAFTPRAIARALPGIQACVDAAVEALEPGSTIDVHAWLTRLAIAIVGRALVGEDLDAPALERAATDALRDINHRIRHPLAAPPWWPGRRRRQARATNRTLDALVDAVLARRRAEAASSRDDAVATLLAAPFDDRAIRDHLVTLVLAGFETAASHLAWTLALLATRPDVEADFLQEIRRLPAQPSVDDLDALPRTARILEESLRLYPPAHTLGRKTRSPLTLGPYALPAGTVALVSPWLLHRRADVFADPERFEPERFAAPLPRYATMPFGAGPRVCLGARFATLEARTVLVALARRVRLVPVTPGLPPAETLMTLRPVGFLARVEAAG
ncbi:MAG: cytochrome P450 [Myxococcales bacterium]|nr:cytochrome P450 [Myxococcales bacterium]